MAVGSSDKTDVAGSQSSACQRAGSGLTRVRGVPAVVQWSRIPQHWRAAEEQIRIASASHEEAYRFLWHQHYSWRLCEPSWYGAPSDFGAPLRHARCESGLFRERKNAH